MELGQIQDVSTFLKAIGRGCDEVAGKFEVMCAWYMAHSIIHTDHAAMYRLGINYSLLAAES